jgi:hypothetical protein
MNSRFTKSKNQGFIDQEAIEEALRTMEQDDAYYTESSYCANSTLYPDNRMPFVAKHLAYLKSHGSVNPEQYISNLKLMTRIR